MTSSRTGRIGQTFPMPHDPDDLIALSREARLAHFLQAAKDNGQLWTLAEEEALLVLGIEGHDEFVVVFPQADVVGPWFETCGLEEADLVVEAKRLDRHLAEPRKVADSIHRWPPGPELKLSSDGRVNSFLIITQSEPAA